MKQLLKQHHLISNTDRHCFHQVEWKKRAFLDLSSLFKKSNQMKFQHVVNELSRCIRFGSWKLSAFLNLKLVSDRNNSKLFSKILSQLKQWPHCFPVRKYLISCSIVQFWNIFSCHEWDIVSLCWNFRLVTRLESGENFNGCKMLIWFLITLASVKVQVRVYWF